MYFVQSSSHSSLWIRWIAGFLLILAANQLQAASYNFDIQYFGSGVTSLAPGSDEPVGTNLQPNDDFLWQIIAQDGAYWKVVTGGDFFPLMAFECDPSGDRFGDFSLKLFDNGVEVFSLSALDEGTSQAHVGTNTVTLPTDLTFDELSLTYRLNSALEVKETAADPNNLQSVDTILQGRLPIFGPPESYDGIVYVPELGSMSLTVMAGVGIAATRLLRRRVR